MAAIVWSGRAAAQEPQQSPEEELAQRHSPILYISILTDCFPDGGYDPTPVELVLDQPDNALYDDDGELVMHAPGAADIFGLPRAYYIAWPGDPRNPGCDYEIDYRALREAHDLPVVTYARIGREDDQPGLAVQYWFFYYFNDFLNMHEADWEMIQVIYDEASTAEEALEQEPTRLAYASHAGGEQADWTDRKVRRDGDHPFVYVTRGSHASYFEPGTYLGVARAGTVFGCDPVEPPFRWVAPQVILLPEAADSPDDPFAWLEFEGLWGEERGPMFSGQLGPKHQRKWQEPISWANGLRHFSERIPYDPIVGLEPLGPVCTIIGWGSQALIWYRLYPWAVGLGVIGLVAMSVTVLASGVPDRLTRTGRRRLAEDADLKAPSFRRPGFLVHPRSSAGVAAWGAVWLYITRPTLFISIGAVFIPIAALLGVVQGLLGTTWLQDQVQTGVVEPAFMAAVSSFGALVATVLAGAAIAAAIGELNAGRPIGFFSAYRLVLRRIVSLAMVNAISVVAILALTISVIGLPLAINRLVAWAFVTHEIMLRNDNALRALLDSAAHVRGNWWRCLGIIAFIGVMLAIPGPAVTFTFLVFTEPPVTQSVHLVNMACTPACSCPWPPSPSRSSLATSSGGARPKRSSGGRMSPAREKSHRPAIEPALAGRGRYPALILGSIFAKDG